MEKGISQKQSNFAAALEGVFRELGVLDQRIEALAEKLSSVLVECPPQGKAAEDNRVEPLICDSVRKIQTIAQQIGRARMVVDDLVNRCDL